MAEENNTNSPTETKLPDKLADFIKLDPKYQEELNTMMADNRKNMTKQNQDLITQLEQLKTNNRLTQEERDELQTRITQLEETYMSKEELAKREAGKKEREFQKQLDTSNKQIENWRTLYTSETIDRSLQDAAVEHKAIKASHIVNLLKGLTQIVEVVDESGKATGRYKPIVKFNDTNEDGKSIVVELTPQEAVKRMTELPDEYGYLFEGHSVSGLGETGGASGSKTQPSLQEITSDPVKYAKWRKENPDLDISKLRR